MVERFFGLHRLGEIVIGHHIKAGPPSLNLGFPRQDDGWRFMAIFYNSFRTVLPVTSRRLGSKNSGLIILNIGRFDADFAAFGLLDLNILVLKDFDRSTGKQCMIIRKQITHRKL